MTVGSQVKSCYSSVKSIEASLNMLSNKAQEQETKDAFNNVQQIMNEIKIDLQQQVIHLEREEPQY
ncbi:DUF1657 domain-containing protein [Virgibacillus sp. NKC19-16]|uniref:DUF1657 domain-containing protein n=1 Tax=Virgibacillus salidurans TaxID=2831673 RepID=UPI001F28EDA0|nr:DUF1657 domain-containing protein [Virgibacillus sp. NKC19-16]UJL47772.1 DUF1657 domain-containing protein [Virgibacillus sp. NKC19-16]